MSVVNALKMLKEERTSLQRELKELDKAIEALERVGTPPAPRTRKTIPSSQKQQDLKRILSLIHAEPGKFTAEDITKMLELSSVGYTYNRLRELLEAGAIRMERNVERNARVYSGVQ